MYRYSFGVAHEGESDRIFEYFKDHSIDYRLLRMRTYIKDETAVEIDIEIALESMDLTYLLAVTLNIPTALMTLMRVPLASNTLLKTRSTLE